MQIGFDFDGVIQNSGIVFRTLLYEKFGTMDFSKTDGAGNVRFAYQIEDVSNTRIWNVIHKALREYQPVMEPVPGAVQLLRKVYHKTGKAICIVTARPEDVFDQTYEWLEEHIGVPCSVTMVAPPKNGGTQNAKTPVINKLGLDAFVEDRFKYASEIAQQCDCIRDVFLLNYPHNVGRRVAAKVKRIDSLFELIPYFFVDAQGQSCASCPVHP